MVRVLGVVVVVWLATASSAFAQTSVPLSQLQLASPSATWTYGPAIAHVCGGNSPGDTNMGTVALSADGQGDAQVTMGQHPAGLVGNPYLVYVTGSGGLQFTMTGSGSISGGGTYKRSLTMTGYGTSFSGTMWTAEYFSNETCYFTRATTLTLAGSGLTFKSPGQGQVDNTTAQIATNLQSTFDLPVNAPVQNIDTTFDAPSPGTIDATNAEGPGGPGQHAHCWSGYPLLV
ncbi:MAG: hypothetical protein JOZ73_14595, partial [Solirubrobacterales bacterium]|nr:hypothetical protein [Solirubrobacterales bacterium]